MLMDMYRELTGPCCTRRLRNIEAPRVKDSWKKAKLEVNEQDRQE